MAGGAGQHSGTRVPYRVAYDLAPWADRGEAGATTSALLAAAVGIGHTVNMDATVAGLIGTAIGAAAGIAGSALTAHHQRLLEYERMRSARMDELARAERQALLDLLQLLAIGTQAVAWLAWAATAQSSARLREEIESYDARMRELLPKLLASEAAAASLSDGAFDRIDPLVRELISLDTAVGTAAATFENNADEATRSLAGAKPRAVELSERSVDEVRALLRGAARQRS